MEYRVLVPIDDDEDRAAAQARTAAQLPVSPDGTTVTVFHVFDERIPPEDEPIRSFPAGRRALEELAEAEVTIATMVGFKNSGAEKLGAVAMPMYSEFLDVDRDETAGLDQSDVANHSSVAEAILAAASEIDADQIIVGGRKRSPLGSVLFGSITQQVILDADRPVTVTGDTSPNDPTHVCQSCGKRYYTDPAETIATCTSCGGAKVEAT